MWLFYTWTYIFFNSILLWYLNFFFVSRHFLLCIFKYNLIPTSKVYSIRARFEVALKLDEIEEPCVLTPRKWLRREENRSIFRLRFNVHLLYRSCYEHCTVAVFRDKRKFVRKYEICCAFSSSYHSRMAKTIHKLRGKLIFSGGRLFTKCRRFVFHGISGTETTPLRSSGKRSTSRQSW